MYPRWQLGGRRASCSSLCQSACTARHRCVGCGVKRRLASSPSACTWTSFAPLRVVDPPRAPLCAGRRAELQGCARDRPTGEPQLLAIYHCFCLDPACITCISARYAGGYRYAACANTYTARAGPSERVNAVWSLWKRGNSVRSVMSCCDVTPFYPNRCPVACGRQVVSWLGVRRGRVPLQVHLHGTPRQWGGSCVVLGSLS